MTFVSSQKLDLEAVWDGVDLALIRRQICLRFLLTRTGKMGKMALTSFPNRDKDMDAGGGAGERYGRYD